MTSSVFLNFFIHKKSLVKPVSLNFLQTLTETALQHILPTIFQYYTNTFIYYPYWTTSGAKKLASVLRLFII